MKTIEVSIADLADISTMHRTASDAVLHAIRDLEASLSAARYNVKRAIEVEMRRDMPYVIHDTSLPGTQILVNRQYKPVGSNEPTGGTWASYEDYPNLHVHLLPQQIQGVVSPPHARGLFGDGNPPWRGRKEAEAYLGRLRRLLELLPARR